MGDAATFRLDGHVATITYNRPDALNAINAEMRRDLNAAFARFRDDDDAWVAIVTGAGRAFCAGGDIRDGAGSAGEFAGNVDRWQIVEHVPPCYSVNFAGCQDAGSGAPSGIRRGRRIDLMALSAPTPETASSTHYFFAFPRSFKLGDAAMEKVFNIEFVRVFGEDVRILEAQQRRIEQNPDAPTIDIRVDAAPLAARRMLADMLAREHQAP